MSGANVVIDESQKQWRRPISQLEWDIAMGVINPPAGYERWWQGPWRDTLPHGGPSTTPTPRARKRRRSPDSL